FLEHLLGLRERGDHQPVPRDEDLVVLAGVHAQLARSEELRARGLHRLLELRALDSELARDVVRRVGPPERARAVLEVAFDRDTEPLRGPRAGCLAEHLLELARRPGEELAFL